MFEAIGTGKNTCYGKNGQKIKIADNHLLTALKEGWITPNFKYLGDSKWHRREGIKEKKVAIMPEKKVYIIKQLELQTKALERIEKELKFIKQKRQEMKILLMEVCNR